MGLSFAPEPVVDDPNAPKPPKPATAPTAAGGQLGLAPPALAPSGAAAGPAGVAGGVSPTMTPPSALMTAPTAAPTPTVAAPTAPVDRVALAKSTYDTLAPTRQAQFEADSRDNVRASAGLGQIASGGLRTREGNLRLARDRDLDTLRASLVNKATEGSIADASTAFQQSLAGAQQNLAGELGRGQLGVSQGSLELEKQKTGLDAALNAAGLTGLLNGQETLAAKQQKIQEAIANKTLSQEDAKLALAQLAQSQGNTIATEQLGLAKTGQEASIGQTQQQIDLAKEKAAQDAAIAQGQLGLATEQFALQKQLGLEGMTLEQAKLAVQEKVANGQITQAQASQALAEKEQQEASGARSSQLQLATTGQAADISARLQGLSLEQAKVELDRQVAANQVSQADATLAFNQLQANRAQGNTEAERALAQENALANFYGGRVVNGKWVQSASADQNQQQIELQKQQVANQAAQFGASQAQQTALAKLSDATQNRQIDVSTAQGKNTLLLELTRIMGGPSGNVDPKFIAAISAALGVGVAPVGQNSEQHPVDTGTSGGASGAGGASGGIR